MMDIAPLGIRLAKTAGFCMGVKRAVDMALDIARKKRSGQIYTYGPLIHNPQTMELLQAQGIKTLDDLESLRGGDVTIIIRAHGISPREKKKIKDLGYEVIDATCPRVVHVQAIIKKHEIKGYHILIVGDPDHPEVNGLLGYAGNRGRVVNDPEEVRGLPPMEKVCVVAQTTQDAALYEKTIQEVKIKYPQAVFYDTICDSTAMRQKEVCEMASEMEAMVIVGGKNSANTKRLAQLCEAQGVDTFLIETADELDEKRIGPFKRIGISAGASTPNWIIDQVMDKVVACQHTQTPFLGGLLRLWAWLIRNDIYAALGAASLAFTGAVLIGREIKAGEMLIASAYVYGMHNLNRYINWRIAGTAGPRRNDLYLINENRCLFASILAIITALAFSFQAGIRPVILLAVISLLGILYHVRIFPSGFRFRSISDIPGSKNISMALAWATVAVILPYLREGAVSFSGLTVSFIFIFYLVFSRSVLSDIRDIQSDRLKGRETMPVLLGMNYVRRFVTVFSLPVLLMIAVAGLTGLVAGVGPALAICLFYVWICLRLCDRRLGVSSFVMEGLLETNYLLAGGVALMWLLLR
ncbi:MAG: 4-hydroxy-3-methylbut-2-enyl diphosphate reductase [Smithellaceae bacterium]|nr:4-hydroxy-3-methylbut-2-enyl diphosphate reductase [Smithellaceae bacterium]